MISDSNAAGASGAGALPKPARVLAQLDMSSKGVSRLSESTQKFGRALANYRFAKVFERGADQEYNEAIPLRLRQSGSEGVRGKAFALPRNIRRRYYETHSLAGGSRFLHSPGAVKHIRPNVSARRH